MSCTHAKMTNIINSLPYIVVVYYNRNTLQKTTRRTYTIVLHGISREIESARCVEKEALEIHICTETHSSRSNHCTVVFSVYGRVDSERTYRASTLANSTIIYSCVLHYLYVHGRMVAYIIFIVKRKSMYFNPGNSKCIFSLLLEEKVLFSSCT